MLRESLDEMEPIESVELDTLIRVLQSPIAALLRSRLQISLWEDEAIPLDRETLELDGLAKWKSKHRLLKDLGRDLDSESMYIHQQAQGMLTPGTMGRVDFDVNQAKIEPVIQAIQAYQVPDIEQIAIDMEISGIHLTGSVGSIHGDTCLEIQAGRVKGKHQLAAWIRQLCLSAAIPERAFQTVMFWPDEKKTDGVNKLTLSPLGDLPEARQDLAKEHLNKLMALFVRARSEPLPLFSEAGLAYASRRASGKNDIVAMKDARKKWKEDRKQPLITHVFGAEAPLESVEPLGDFRELSESVFGPLCRAGGKSTG
jgi:exodeoxyribonuclease V gamma subunit